MGNEVASVKSPGAPGEGGDFLREENLRGHFNNPPMPQPAKPEKRRGAEAGEAGTGIESSGRRACNHLGVSPDIKEGEIGRDPQLDRALELLKSWKVFKALTSQSTETG